MTFDGYTQNRNHKKNVEFWTAQINFKQRPAASSSKEEAHLWSPQSPADISPSVGASSSQPHLHHSSLCYIDGVGLTTGKSVTATMEEAFEQSMSISQEESDDPFAGLRWQISSIGMVEDIHASDCIPSEFQRKTWFSGALRRRYDDGEAIDEEIKGGWKALLLRRISGGYWKLIRAAKINIFYAAIKHKSAVWKMKWKLKLYYPQYYFNKDLLPFRG